MPMRWQPAAPMAVQQHGGRIKLADHPELRDEARSEGVKPVAEGRPAPSESPASKAN
jgi:hypothetical protein